MEEIQRLNDKLDELHQENQALRDGDEMPGANNSHSSSEELDQVKAKLSEALELYQTISRKLSSIQQTNDRLMKSNHDLTRENDSLRADLAQRTPIRHGRFTIATLEGQIETHKKEIKNLEKALTLSDEHIEKLQTQLKQSQADVIPQLNVPIESHKQITQLRQSTGSLLSQSCVQAQKSSASRSLPLHNGSSWSHPHTSIGHKQSLTSSSDDQIKSNGNCPLTDRKDLSVDHIRKSLFQSTVSMDIPSPFATQLSKQSEHIEHLSRSHSSTTGESLPSHTITSSSNMYGGFSTTSVSNTKPKQSPVTSLLADRITPNVEQFHKSPDESSNQFDSSSMTVTPTKRKRMDDSSFDLEMPSPVTPSTTLGQLSLVPKSSQEVSAGLRCPPPAHVFDGCFDDDSVDLEQELVDHDVTVTEELTDCLRLMNKAERNVKNRLEYSDTPNID